MRRPLRIALIVLAAAAGLLILAVVGILIAVHSPPVQRYAASKIAAMVEESTGAKASMGRLSLSLFPLALEADDIVIHGTEAAGEPPLLRARRLKVALSLRAILQHQAGIDSLEVDQPQAYVRIAPDGTTNLPHPKTPPPPSDKNPLQTVVDLAIRHVALNDGLLQFADRKTPFNLRGENLHAVFVYHSASPSYTGSISLNPAYLQSANGSDFPVKVDVPFEITAGRITVDNATFDARVSSLRLRAVVDDLNAPRLTANLEGRFSPAELAHAFDPSLEPQVRAVPPIAFRLSTGIDGNRAEVSELRMDYGSSFVKASGVLNDLKNVNGTFRLDGSLVLAELGRVLKLSAKPQGTVLVGGDVRFSGTGNYWVQARIDGHQLAFSAGRTRITGAELASAIDADPRTVHIKDLRLAALSGTLTGSGEFDRAQKAYRLDADLHGFDLRQLVQTYASPKFVWDGVLSGPVHAQGSLGPDPERRLVATTRLTIAPGRRGVPLSGLIDARYDGPANAISLGDSYLSLPSTRLSFSGAINRQLSIQLASRNLDDLLPALAMASQDPPQSMPIRLVNGTAAFTGVVTGTLSDPHISGHTALTNFIVQDHKLDRFAADVDATRNAAGVTNLSIRAGQIELTASGSLGLHNWKPADADPIAANASIRSADVRPVLALAGRPEEPLTGALSVDVQATGTFADPHARVQLALSGGQFKNEPYQRLQAVLTYSANRIDLNSAQVVLAAGQVDASGTFEHSPKDYKTGHVQFHLASSPIVIEKLKIVRQNQPDVAGTVEFGADGAALLQSVPGQPLLVPQSINGRLSAHTTTSGRRPLADVQATATMRGRQVVFDLDSKVADSTIRGSGTLDTAGGYPLDARLTFTPVKFGAVERLLAKPGTTSTESIDGSVEGNLTVSGPLMTPENLKGALNLTKLEVTAPIAASGRQQTLVIRNAAPIVITVDRRTVVVQSARFNGPSISLNLSGKVDLATMQTDAHADGDIGLQLIQALDPDVFAGGDIRLNAAVKGPLSQPHIDGRLDLRNVSINQTGVNNGLANVNGEIVFSGTQAEIRKLTGQSGGGDIVLGGVVRYGGPALDFRLNGTVHHVRLRPSNTLSAQINAKLSLAGTTDHSLVSGNVTILDVAMLSHSDIGSMLTETATPPSAPSDQTGLLANMRFDVRIDTAAGFQLESELSQDLQADAHLRLRGSPSRPAMLGRITADGGTLVFFGKKYTVTEGVVKFQNPTSIDPVVDLGLETRANGITVDLAVKGPVDHLKLTYTSDPPMQFSDMVSLLATGKVSSTTDPVLAAQQSPAPQQSFAQTGASAILNQSVAAPVSGQLQRLFGVTSLKIDPQIIGPESIPQAQMALEQQITKDLSFTYIQDLTSSNPQVIRIEWAMTPVWSAIATREPDGEFGVDLYYKWRFH
jgi:translocation and assembly module TamB